MEFTHEELYTVLIWVKFHGLDIKYWGPKELSKIGSLIGKPLMVDRNTERKIGLNFAQLLIEVEVDTELPDMVYFKNEKEEECYNKRSVERGGSTPDMPDVDKGELSKGKNEMQMVASPEGLKEREHTKQTRCITPTHHNRSKQRKENVVQLNPFNILGEGSTSEMAHNSPILHEEGNVLSPRGSG
ncbi:hypothetical protein KY284_036269 [Solanum tuberosum]|nr:hypothetical protein KY284_036269 [Solanum tuberosum]